jgi:hypothetical protein
MKDSTVSVKRPRSTESIRTPFTVVLGLGQIQVCARSERARADDIPALITA